MKTQIVAVTVILFLSSTPLVTQDQTLTAVVNRIDISVDFGNSNVADSLTDSLLAALVRTRAFDVVDGRVGGEVDANFYVNVSLHYIDEPIDDGIDADWNDDDEEQEALAIVGIVISAADGSGRVFFTDSGEQSVTYERKARSWRETLTGQTSADPAEMGARMQTVGAPMLVDMAERLRIYFDIMGPRSMPVDTVEGSVVAVMDATTAVIDAGSAAGLRAGDALEVRRGLEVTNDAGEVVFSRLESVGAAEVSEVQDQGAVITTAASLALEEGDTVVRAAPELSAAEYVTTGDALMDATLYAPAVGQYLAARRSDPGLLDVLLDLTVAQLKSGDHDAAYISVVEVLDAGRPVELAATHNHSFGSCQGTFTLTRDSLSYRSPKEDDPDHRFNVPLERITEASLRFEEDLVLRAPSTEQFEKNSDDSKNWTIRFDLHGENTEVARIVTRYVSERR
ncbi:MAG: hypothetical protein OXF27_04835 [Acidobacteria bacterium]|nr:hypothetical protein [Acidobacteriota bacterium]